MEADLMKALSGAATYGTSAFTVRSEPDKTLTYEVIKDMMAKLPPRQVWLSSRAFPLERAMTVKGRHAHFTVAHPDFWTKAFAALPDRRLSWRDVNPLFPSMAPINVDFIDGEPEHMRDYKVRLKADFIEVMDEVGKARDGEQEQA